MRAGSEPPRAPAASHLGFGSAHVALDSWLEHFYGERLAGLDAACAAGEEGDAYRLFRDLDDDLWAMLLTQQYGVYPHIRRVLPDLPEAALQELWNGASGLPLAVQSKDFYVKLGEAFKRHGRCGLDEADVLDFGCGWGRVIRYLARDVSPGRLFGCDPVEEVLEVCRSTGVPGTLARSEFLLERLPFEHLFDLIYAFSVFTHLSEPAHDRALTALHQSLYPGGVLVVTIRPPAYLGSEPMRALGEAATPNGLSGPRYLFVPHPTNPWQPEPSSQDEITYGEAVLTLDYVRERWRSRFELLEVGLLISDPYQVTLTLRRAD